VADQLEVQLVNAHHVKNVPGRKGDAVDAEWLALTECGLLRGSFSPPRDIAAIGELTGYRKKLTQARISAAPGHGIGRRRHQDRLGGL
jgi:hypothetical protein